MDAIGEEHAIFPFKFIFCSINKFDGIIAQLSVLRHMKRYRIINRKAI